MVSASGATGAAAPESGQRAQAGARVGHQRAVDEVGKVVEKTPLLRGRGRVAVHGVVVHVYLLEVERAIACRGRENESR